MKKIISLLFLCTFALLNAETIDLKNYERVSLYKYYKSSYENREYIDTYVLVNSPNLPKVHYPEFTDILYQKFFTKAEKYCLYLDKDEAKKKVIKEKYISEKGDKLFEINLKCSDKRNFIADLFPQKTICETHLGLKLLNSWNTKFTFHPPFRNYKNKDINGFLGKAICYKNEIIDTAYFPNIKECKNKKCDEYNLNNIAILAKNEIHELEDIDAVCALVNKSGITEYTREYKTANNETFLKITIPKEYCYAYDAKNEALKQVYRAYINTFYIP